MSELDKDVIEQLKASKEAVGAVDDVKVDQHGRTISGRHRLESDPQWPKKIVQVKDDEDFFLKRMASKIQRVITEDERKADLIELAQCLEKKGVAKEQVSIEVCKKVPWLSKSYITRLLPEEYKQKPLVEAGRRGGEARLSLAFANPEELVVKMVELRDEGLHYAHLYREPMANSIPNYFRVSYAIDKGKPLELVLQLMNGIPVTKESPRASEHAVKTYTTAEQKLAEAFSRLKVNFRTNVPIERPDVTVDGKPMQYFPDFIVEEKYICEVEGAGSSSKDNATRDEFLISKGYTIKHVSNESVMHNPDELAKSLIDEFRGTAVAVKDKEELKQVAVTEVKEGKKEETKAISKTKAKKIQEYEFQQTCPSCSESLSLTLEFNKPLPKDIILQNIKVKIIDMNTDLG